MEGRRQAAGKAGLDNLERPTSHQCPPLRRPSPLPPPGLTSEQAEGPWDQAPLPQPAKWGSGRATENPEHDLVTYLSSFMAMSKGSVSPSSSTITGAHILWEQGQVLGRLQTQPERPGRESGVRLGPTSQTGRAPPTLT